MENNKFTKASFLNAKEKNEKITMLTAYDYSTARLLDDVGIDAILIGDSLGMVMLGYEDTLQVTMEDMLHHTRAVARGTRRAMVITDMPFMSYHISVEDSIRNAGRIIKEGCANAVKLEGGREVAEKIEAIVKAQIPVMGHLGLTPQSVNVFGGFKVQGKDENNARKILEDALILQEAGVFAIVLECVPEKLAKLITEKLDIPTIGIGAGKFCDGQILVVQDMLGMYSDLKPRFVKRYGEIGREMNDAIAGYINDVKNSKFPDEAHVFSISDEIINKLY